MSQPPERIGVDFRMKNFGRVHPQESYIGDASDEVCEDNGGVEYLRADLVEAEMNQLKMQHAQAFSAGWDAAQAEIEDR